MWISLCGSVCGYYTGSKYIVVHFACVEVGINPMVIIYVIIKTVFLCLFFLLMDEYLLNLGVYII